jgi:polar amino acid transport system ATP-binding protein
MTALVVDSVRKAFGATVVLDGLDLSVGDHEVACLIGASGSGKSTLLRCIDLLEPIDDGRILLGGDDITDPDVDEHLVRRRMGIVFQSYNLFPHLTVLANVTLGPRKALKVGRADAEARAMALLDRFGLAGHAGQHPDRLSGGQQQRVAIVRALAMDPEVLLLDEITSALDPALVGSVLDVIRELRTGGMTMVLATHEMGFAREIADQVHFLDRGRILESAPPADLFDTPREPATQRFLERIHDARRLPPETRSSE